MSRINPPCSVSTRVFALTVGCAAAIAIIAVGPSVARAQSASEPFAPSDFAAIHYLARDADVRSLTVRVSRWANTDRAANLGQSLLAGARSNLPVGEFYQTDAVDVPIPEDALTPPAGARRWRTIIGVAAFTTEWLVLVVQRETLLWDFRVSGGKNVSLLDVAVALAAEITGRERGDSLFTLLPTADDVPRGMVVQYTMSPSGAFDAQGSPIPPPTPE